jgi:hypothetical protein
MNGRAVVVASILAGLLPSAVEARPPTTEELPAGLRDWQGWVLHDDATFGCPFLQGSDQRPCIWPGRLQLTLDEKGGSFSQALHAYREEWITLPGDLRRWPQAVKLDGRDALVVPHAERPAIRVPAGDHTVSGSFLWDTLPEAIAVPTDVALLALTVRGKAVALPNRDADGKVFLQKESTAEEAENLEVTASRKMTDEIPFILTTHVELNVSGKNREVLLGRALPEGFVAMSVSSALPVRLEADGRLRLQVRPGTWTVDLVARHDSPVTHLKRPNPDGPWGLGEEVWAFEARPALRQVLVEGASAVDPTQTRLPTEWKRLPAYSVGLDTTVQLTERARGDADPPPDLLRIDRDLWLDFDGQGMTASDRISGQLHRSWRMEVLPGTELGRVVAGGADQSITQLGAGKPPGVELRQGNLVLEAESRIPGDPGRISAVSWNADFHQVSATLQLPPGWRLLHASGADDVRETWIHAWTLLDIFLVLVISLAVGRLFGVAWGAVALVALTLSFNERDAPRYAWLVPLVGEALLRVLPDHAFKTLVKAFRLAAWAALVVIGVGFMVEQVRWALYPSLEQQQRLGEVQSWTDYSSGNAAQYLRSSSVAAQSDLGGNGYGVANEPEPRPPGDGPMGQRTPMPQAKVMAQRSVNVRDFDKNAMVQTGPGLPRWNWTAVKLSFSGPVEPSQVLRFWFLSPRVNLFLAFARVALLALLLLCVLGFPGSFWPRILQRGSATAGISLVAAALAMLTLLFARPARAADKASHSAESSSALPDQTLLDQLKARLLEPPECAPTCASSPRVELQVSPSQVQIRVELLAAAQTSVPLPGNAQHWSPDQVLLDGKPADALRRGSEGSLWIAVGPGVHQVLMQGALPLRETVQIALPLKAGRTEAHVEGWSLDGLHEDGLADDNLQLTRISRDGGTRELALQTGALPPFVRVERTLKLGLQWTVETRVVRLTPVGSAVVLEVPLLPGESVTTVDVRIQDAKALVNMGPSTTEASWVSVLPQRPTVELKAPTGLPWVEVWKLDVSPIWHVQLAGIPVVHQQDADGVRLPEWHPWPGEAVTIAVTRPDTVPGQTFTIDQSKLTLTPGVRASDASLTFNLRSSQGGLHALTLPPGAQLSNVTINGAQEPIRQEGEHVAIPLVPGSQSVELSWREPSGIGGFYETPAVDLGTPSVNADLELVVPQDRWVLFVGGPRMGPAVLFWSFFLVLLLVSAGLARIPWTPLKTHHWLLLALGLSQVPIPAAAVVFGWLLLLGWRQTEVEIGGPGNFDLRQLLIVGVTLVALGILTTSVYEGLLGRPEMQISGNGSSGAMLRWFQDRSPGAMPIGWVVSVPMFVYRGAMLAWSLWLAFALLRWLRWAWTAFSAGGLWRRTPKVVAPPPAPGSHGGS